jgi:hypothetical protein
MINCFGCKKNQKTRKYFFYYIQKKNKK